MDAGDDLVEQLLLVAGMVMEDAAPALIVSDRQESASRIAILHRAAIDLRTLAAAISVVERYHRRADGGIDARH